MTVVVILWAYLKPSEKFLIMGISIEISTIYIREKWESIAMEQMKYIYNHSKLQISSSKYQGKFFWTGIPRLQATRNDSVQLI